MPEVSVSCGQTSDEMTFENNTTSNQVAEITILKVQSDCKDNKAHVKTGGLDKAYGPERSGPHLFSVISGGKIEIICGGGDIATDCKVEFEFKWK